MSKQPKPDSKKYTDLISDIEKGVIKVPKFQRNFVWSLEETAKLLDSILKGYPIGTFILWETKERMNDIKNIGNLELTPAPKDGKVQYVLDGQQRITSLYAAFEGAEIKKENEKKSVDYSKIYVDLADGIEDGDNQIVLPEKPEGKSITLHKLLTAKFSELREEFSPEEIDKIQAHKETFTTYDFSIIILRKEDVDSAIEVFTRINTGGTTLTLFEIMSAKTYDENAGFDMEEKFQKLLEKLSDVKKYDTISSSVILSTLSLVVSPSKECKRKIILQLDKQKIIDAWDGVISALEESIEYFHSVYRIPVSAILPYDALLVPFTYFFHHRKRADMTEDQRKFLEEFFWRMSLSFRYTSGTESKLAQDIKRIDEILGGNRPNYDGINTTLRLNSPQDLIATEFSAGNSYCKAILCLLAYHQPKNFNDNGIVNLDNSWLKQANSKNYHHFFPKAFLKKQGVQNENSIVNITLVSESLNKGQIGAKAPSAYIKKFSEENEGFPNSIASHLIGDLDDFGILADDYNRFLEQRAKKIFDELTKRISAT